MKYTVLLSIFCLVSQAGFSQELAGRWMGAFDFFNTGTARIQTEIILDFIPAGRNSYSIYSYTKQVSTGPGWRDTCHLVIRKMEGDSLVLEEVGLRSML